MKKTVIGLFVLCLLLCYQTVFAGTCGTNVKYTIKDNILTYSKADSAKDADWAYDCSDAYNSNITVVKIADTIRVTKAYRLFEGFSNVKKMYLSKLDVSAVTDMRRMFYNLRYLTNLDVSGWDTSKVTDMGNMFYRCSSLKTLDLSSWNVSRVTGMNQMFAECSVLSNLNLNGWNTAYAEKMDKMFYNCSALTWLDLSEWNTTRVTDNPAVFNGCTKLETLILGKNTLKNNIFETLPNYSSEWIYIMAGPAAESPLKLKTKKSNGELFSGYKYKTMAGIWSMNETPVLADAVTITNSSGTDITGKTLTLDNHKYQLKAVAQPVSSILAVIWKSSDTDVAEVSTNGMVTFKKAGTVTVTAVSTDGNVTAKVKLKLPLLKMTDMSVITPSGKTANGKTLTGYVGSSYAYTIKPKPVGASNAVTWKSSKTSVVTITSAGKATCKTTGSAKITATAKDGSKVSVSFTIKCAVPKMKSMTIKTPSGKVANGKTLTGYVGKSYAYTIIPTPAAASKAVTWKSSKTSVVTITSAGKATCKAAGSAKITATAKDGSKVKVSFTIKCVKK